MNFKRFALKSGKAAFLKALSLAGVMKPVRPETVDDGQWQPQHRRHIELMAFIEESGSPKGGKVLDVGCGPGYLLRRLRKAGFTDLTGCDWLDKEIEGCRYDQIDINREALSLYPDASFDTIISSDVIEHLENPSQILKEFSRLLRPDGSIFITIPNATNLFERLYFLCTGNSTRYQSERTAGPYGHINLFTSQILESLADKAGIRLMERRGGYGYFFGHFMETHSPLLAYNLMFRFTHMPAKAARRPVQAMAEAAGAR